MGESGIRGHNLRIRSYPLKTEMRRNFFSLRVVNLWNSLLQKAAKAGSLSMFKAEIYRFLISKGIKGYGAKVGKWS